MVRTSSQHFWCLAHNTTGINLEFARILLRNGANVLIGDLSLRPEAQKLVDEYTNKSDGPKVVFHKTDVSSWSDLHSLFKTAEEQFSTFDIVCPGVGIFEPAWSGFWSPPGSQKSKDTISSDGYKSLDVNLIHPIRASQLAISHFLGSSSPASKDNMKTIVHIASIAGTIGFAPVPLYCASKWGLRGFIYSLGELEETRHIRVTGLAPAIVRTPIWLDAEDKARMVHGADGKEQDDWVTPEEVAEVVSTKPTREELESLLTSDQMFKVCTEDEITTAKGEKLSLRGGSLIEVVHGDVKDVPVFGNQPPGTGTDQKGITMMNVEEAWKDMNAAIDQPEWGKV